MILPYFRCPTFRVKTGCSQSKESGKYCVLLRKAAAYLVTNKGNIQAGASLGLDFLSVSKISCEVVILDLPIMF